MSEVMTQAIIGMPFDMAMGDELSRLQFHGRAQALLAEYSRLEQECERLKEALREIEWSNDSTWQSDRAKEALSAKP